MRDPKNLAKMGPILKLESHHLRVLDLLVFGLDRPAAKLPGMAANTPLSVESVAHITGYRRAFIRRLLEDRLFKATYEKAVQAKRQALHPMAVTTIGELMVGSKDDGVRLRAAATALGDQIGGSVNVQVNNNIQNNLAVIRPGYVLRLPPGAPMPETIEAEPNG